LDYIEVVSRTDLAVVQRSK